MPEKAGGNKAAKHLHPADLSLHDTEYLPPPTLTFNPSIFPLFLFPSSLPLFVAAAGGALLFVAGQGRVGQAFTSPLPPAIVSLICAPSGLSLSLFTPAPLYSPHPSLPLSRCL